MFDDIDANIRILLEGAQEIKYHEHIGGGHYVSVTTGFRCVDFWRSFLPQDQKPTKKGVALRLDEWAKMRNIVETIDDNHPSLASAIPCYLQEDHQNQMGALQCPECHPFRTCDQFFSRIVTQFCFSDHNATRLKITELAVRTNSDLPDTT